jgi:NAD(P)-dependent dehydrogenase (short-subunit alcohol dehydrogenase family)
VPAPGRDRHPDDVRRRQQADGLAGVPADQADIGAALETMIPLGRVAQPQEIAEWSVFLVAKGATVATGSDFIIDGGFTAGGNAGM